MSLHATISPKAEQRLRFEKRISTLSSIAISLLAIALVGLVLAYILLPSLFVESPTIVTYSADPAAEEEIQQKQINRQVQRQPSAPSSAMAKVIASAIPSAVAIPIPEVDSITPSTDFGSGDDFGDGWGNGDGTGGGGFGNIPATMRKRCSKADRLARLDGNGGNEQCEEAVIKALRWLKKTQNADGSWSKANPAAMTGFAVLAFLGHCETPLSEEFGDAVLRGMTYLVDLGMKNDGRISTSALTSNHWVYEQGIATYALAEGYTFCSQLGINIPNLAEITKKAGDQIIAGQGENGGWVYRYAPTRSGDNSVGFWQIQALKACKHTGLWDEGAFRKVSTRALAWLDQAQGKNGSIGYRGNPAQSPGLTGGGVLAFQMWDKGTAKNVRAGIKYLSANTSFNWGDKSSNLYYHYYDAQAMINYGGPEWRKYNDLFRDVLLKNQAADGTWPHKFTAHGNLHMNTCLATFMLEVYYRFLPATGAATH